MDNILYYYPNLVQRFEVCRKKIEKKQKLWYTKLLCCPDGPSDRERMEEKKMKTMNTIKGKIVLGLMLICLMVAFVPALPAYASNGQQTQTQTQTQTAATTDEFANITAPVEQLIRKITAPMMGIVGALGSVFCIILGVKFAKAEEPQEREKAKAHLKNAIIGFVLIFVLLLVLNRSIGPLTTWVTNNANNTGL